MKVPCRAFNIHRILPSHKRFFIMEKASSDCLHVLHTFKICSLEGSFGNPKWFFYAIAVKTPFWTIFFKWVKALSPGLNKLWLEIDLNLCQLEQFSLRPGCIPGGPALGEIKVQRRNRIKRFLPLEYLLLWTARWVSDRPSSWKNILL